MSELSYYQGLSNGWVECAIFASRGPMTPPLTLQRVQYRWSEMNHEPYVSGYFPELSEFIRREGHKGPMVIGMWFIGSNRWAAKAMCYRCDKNHVTWADEPANGLFLDWFSDAVYPLVENLVEDPCWKLSDQGMLAEWLAKLLRNKGAVGISILEVLDICERQDQAPPAMVEFVCRKMGLFSSDRPGILELPEGHPWRTW